MYELHAAHFRLENIAMPRLGRSVVVRSLALRTAIGAFLQAAREVKQKGTFDFARTAVSYAEINAMFKP
ncbi:MAG TPA: hypothetical protein VHI75_08815 [Casimicrobiaceae bacterium]|jgi:hypothetical protein|nr:hypothetical protein [Candidatus Eremiobacteraceae bacterium]HVR93933.1 hypothetical protein [Casimicrobiaceae bacterium]